MRIEKSVFKYIEHELYNYDETKKNWQDTGRNIGRHTFQEVTYKRTGNPTAQKAIKLTSSAFIVQAEKLLAQ